MRGNRVRNAVLIGLGILAVLTAVVWLFVLAPRLATAGEIEAQADDLANTNLALRGEYNQRLALARQAPQAAKDAVDLFTRMPTTAELPKVLTQITRAAARAGIAAGDVTTLRTGLPVAIDAPAAPGVEGARLAQLPVEISATGTRPQVLRFLENLQQLDRAVLVASTDIASEDPARHTLSISGSLFILQSRLPDLVAQVEELLASAGQPTAAAN